MDTEVKKLNVLEWLINVPSSDQVAVLDIDDFAKQVLKSNRMIKRWFASVEEANQWTSKRMDTFDTWAVRVDRFTKEVFLAKAVVEYSSVLEWYDDRPAVKILQLAWAIITDLAVIASPDVDKALKLDLLGMISESGYGVLYVDMCKKAFPATSEVQVSL